MIVHNGDLSTLGNTKLNETTFINGSLLNEYYNLVNSPWEFEYPKE